VLGFGAAAVLAGTLLEHPHEVLVDTADQEVRHLGIPDGG
jgi:hypothetical protein